MLQFQIYYIIIFHITIDQHTLEYPMEWLQHYNEWMLHKPITTNKSPKCAPVSFKNETFKTMPIHVSPYHSSPSEFLIGILFPVIIVWSTNMKSLTQNDNFGSWEPPTNHRKGIKLSVTQRWLVFFWKKIIWNRSWALQMNPNQTYAGIYQNFLSHMQKMTDATTKHINNQGWLERKNRWFMAADPRLKKS